MKVKAARRMLASTIALVALALLPSVALGAVQPYGTNDGGGFRNILPPGENGLVNPSDAIQFESAGTLPPHANDQVSMYENLVYATPGLTAAQLPNYYKDATFGAQTPNIERTYSPRAGCTRAGSRSRSGTCRSGTCGCTIRGITAGSTRSTTISSSSRWR